jgi:hypothetical protein
MSQLTHAKDAKRPWSPLSIAVLTLIFSPVAGGLLHGLNYERLGRQELQSFALCRNLVAGTGILVFFVLLGAQPSSGIVVSLLFAAYFYKTQEEPFQDHLSQGGKKGSLLMAILLAILTAMLAAILAIALGLALPK